MVQKIPKALDLLMAFIATMVRGLNLFEVVLGVKQNTKVAAQADLDASEKAQNEAKAAEAARKAATAARDAADKKVSTFITVAREVFKPKIGSHYSVAWKEVGFVNNSLALASTLPGRVTQVKAIELYLEAHPEMEVPDMVTADIASDLHATAVAAISDLGIALTTQRQKTAARAAAADQLRKRARGLFQELKLLIPDNDPRWIEFGFNVPTDISVPGAPQGVTVTAGAAGKALLKWDRPVHTDRFHIFQEVVGVDAEPVKIATVTATSQELSGLTSGAHVKFYLTAVNAAGESVPSQTVEVVVA